MRTLKYFCMPLMAAFVLVSGSVVPASAQPEDDAPAAPWPPEDTHGKYLPVPEDFYHEAEVPACGSMVTLSYGDVREVEYKARTTHDGGLRLKFRGDATMDVKRQDGAFIDELDISGRFTETRSKDGRSLRVALYGPSIVFPPSDVESAALTKAGLPTLLYFEEGKLTIKVYFSEDSEEPPVSAEVKHNQVKDPVDVCDMLDDASGHKDDSGHHGSDDHH